MGRKVPPPSPVPGYHFIELISDVGFFGTVYKAYMNADKSIVAIKQIRFQPEEMKDDIPKEVLREISLLRMLNDCENIVRLLDVHHNKKQRVFSLIFEWMEMDLHHFIKAHVEKSKLVPKDQVKDLMRQLLTGVSLIHSHSAMHRDLRPANLLIESKSLTLKIADFGRGRQYNIPTGEYSIDGTYLSYKAPEILQIEKERNEKKQNDEVLHTEYTVSADMWSVGCIFAELVSGERPFDATKKDYEGFEVIDIIHRELGLPTSVVLRMIQQLRHGEQFIEEESDEEEDFTISADQIQRTLNTTAKKKERAINLERAKKLHLKFAALSNDGFDLLSRMLVDMPEERISAQDALAHPYFH